MTVWLKGKASPILQAYDLFAIMNEHFCLLLKTQKAEWSLKPLFPSRCAVWLYSTHSEDMKSICLKLWTALQMHSDSPLKLIHKAAPFDHTFQSQGGSIESFTNTNKPTPRCRIPHLELLSSETSKKDNSHKSCFYYSQSGSWLPLWTPRSYLQ